MSVSGEGAQGIGNFICSAGATGTLVNDVFWADDACDGLYCFFCVGVLDVVKGGGGGI